MNKKKEPEYAVNPFTLTGELYSSWSIKRGTSLNYEAFRKARFYGLEYMKDKCENSTILSLGCAEGEVEQKFGEYKISLLHGVDMHEPSILEMKKNLTRDFAQKQIILKCTVDNFSVSNGFLERNKKWLLDSYDIGLFLGIFWHLHHGTYTTTDLEKEYEQEIKPLVQKINKYIVGRGRGIDNIIFEGWIKKHGFKKIFRKAGNSRLAVGPLVIFKRQTSRAVDCEKL